MSDFGIVPSEAVALLTGNRVSAAPNRGTSGYGTADKAF